MNIDIEVTFKVRASDEKEAKPERCRAMPLLGHLLDKLSAHPCVLFILRELTKG